MEVKIIKFDHLGNGIAREDGKVIFVNRALPNEIVDIELINNKKKYQSAKIRRIIKKSDERIEPICPYYDKCGGCNFLHTNKDNENKFKINKCCEVIGYYTKYLDTAELNYRNKVKLHVKDKKIGFYQEKTNDIIEIDYCYLLDDKINDVIKKLKEYVNKNECNINDITIRCSKELLLIINGEVPHNFVNSFDFVENIVINNKVVKGKGYIVANIDKYNFKISPNSFFQVNYKGLENIFKILKSTLNEIYKNALDLYSGTSVMGILMSDFCDLVTSIESNTDATNDALINIKNNNVNNIRVINDKVENVIDTLDNIDLIIVDPPRSGLDQKTINHIMKIKAKTMIYISCDMITLKRDLEYLKEIYDIKDVNLVNMFPRTYHVESVVILKLK